MIPKPLSFKAREGRCLLKSTLPLSVENSISGCSRIANYLRTMLSPLLSVSLLDTTTPHNTPLQHPIRIEIYDDKTLHPEIYKLSVDQNRIRLSSPTLGGLIRAASSLVQLIYEQNENGSTIDLPFCEISDQPALEWRGMHLDVSRHFFPVQVIERILEILALYKINIFHWHLTDDQGWRIQIDSYPRLTEIGAYRTEEDGKQYGGYYSKDDIRHIVNYALELGITVVPEIEMPGHSSAVLAAYPEFSCHGNKVSVPNSWGIFNDVLCPSKPQTIQFLEAVLDEVCELFPGQWIHIGGDECPTEQWESCPDCKELIRHEKLAGVDYLQGWLNHKIAIHLKRHCKTLVGWDEILDRGAPEEAVVMAWRGVEHGVKAIEQGYKTVMSPTRHCYFDYAQAAEGESEAFPAVLTLKDVMAFEPFPEALNPDQQKLVLGGQGNLWTEQINDESHLQYMLLPRLCALAEIIWTGRSINDVNDFHLRLQKNIVLLESLGLNYRKIEVNRQHSRKQKNLNA